MPGSGRPPSVPLPGTLASPSLLFIRTCSSGYLNATSCCTVKYGKFLTKTRPSGISGEVWLPRRNTRVEKRKITEKGA